MKKLLLLLPLLYLNIAHSEPSTSVDSIAPQKSSVTKNAPTAAIQAKPVDLKTAYKREYAFLDAQKRELQKRLSQFKVNANSDERILLNKINVLERGSVTRSDQIDQMSTEFNLAEQGSNTGVERDEALQMTYSQAEATLRKYQIETDTQIKYSLGSNSEKVVFLFNRALELVNKLGKLHSGEGDFFLSSGKKVRGEIIQIGNIAAFGVSNEGSGALVPAGSGSLKLWRQPAADTALALSKDEPLQQLKIFLFESREKAIEETPEKTWLSIIESGGIIGWIIVCLGGLAVVLVLVRVFLLFSNSSDTQKLTVEITEHLNKGNMAAAKKICQTGSCAITRVMESTLRHIKDDRDHMEDIISEAILQESAVLNKFGTSILVIASVAPLLGLLGTVTGMISTFDIITEFGTGDPKLLSGGISIALVTTELGLIVAIPTLLLGSLLSAWSENIKIDMEVAALRTTNTLLSNAEMGQMIDMATDTRSTNDHHNVTAQPA